MSYTLFSVDIGDGQGDTPVLRHMPAAWQNFIADLSAGHPNWSELSDDAALRLIEDQLRIVWFARLERHPDRCDLVFDDERWARWFMVRWI